MTVIDASAILGLLFREDRANPVVGYLADAGISAVNLAEVVGKLADVGIPASVAVDLVHRLNLDVLPFTERHAVIAGELRAATSRLGLSLGDRACLATGLIDGDRVVTLDRAWSDTDLGVPIVVFD